jgi:hypothetical protein
VFPYGWGHGTNAIWIGNETVAWKIHKKENIRHDNWHILEALIERSGNAC